MGENLALKERSAVRTPMQWSAEPNGGFSSAKPTDLVHAMKADGAFGYETVNVSAQIRDPASLMHAIEAMIKARRSAPEIGWGEWEVIDVGNDDVLVLSYFWRNGRVVTAHNFSDRAIEMSIAIDAVERFEPILASRECPSWLPADAPIELEPFGYCWLRCDHERR